MSKYLIVLGFFAVVGNLVQTPAAHSAGCGDGVIDAGEECDDLNAVAGDGCADTCAIEDGWACVGEPSTCAFTCGNGAIDAGEQCDLGLGNCAPDVCCATSCNSTCRINGLCSGAQICCTAASECPEGQTCCGNGIVDDGEQCDDGNRVDHDCCSSSCEIEGSGCVPYPAQCGLLGSVNVIANPSIRFSIFKEGNMIDGKFHWIFRSRFNLRDGMQIDPDTEIVQLIFNRNDGNGGSEPLHHSVLDPGLCPSGRCFTPNTAASGTDRSWRFNLAGLSDFPGAPGWRRAVIRRRLISPYSFRTAFRLIDVSLPPPEANGVRRARQSLMVGNICVTRLVDCERNDDATRYVCRDAHCGDGILHRGEQCGEAGLPACSGGDVCDTCRCVEPLP